MNLNNLFFTFITAITGYLTAPEDIPAKSSEPFRIMNSFLLWGPRAV